MNFRKKLELLAPAGSKEAFFSAIKAGADSMYTGVDKYNARLNADRLNLYDLEVLTNYAHEKNKKIYLALNTLIKHEEIYDAVKTLEKINVFKPDAIILQDLGLARIIKEEFPQLKLHASTQLAVHSRAGVEVLAKLGFERVILARELSQGDLKQTASKSPVELEIFCHGALCFSVSGMCLFSSFIGSRSGNRGWCTQPCRRIWKTSKKTGYLFSPKDLQLVEEIQNLGKIGIDSLKIEGRMRSSEYVFNVVSAYRMIIDAPEEGFNPSVQEAKKMLSRDWARSKTSLFFSGSDKTLFNPANAQCLGMNIGSVVNSNGTRIILKLNSELTEGDRIRISDPSNDITKTIKITEFKKDGDLYSIGLDENFKPGSPVFKAGDANWNEKILTKEVDAIYKGYNGKVRGNTKYQPLTYPDLIARQWCESQKSEGFQEERLWVKIDNPDWLEVLPLNSKRLMIVLSINTENMYNFKAIAGTLQYQGVNFACELTPYISQKEFASYSRIINAMAGAGIKFWILNNISHFKYFSNDTPKVSGHFLYTMNAFTGRVYKDLGTEYFTVSWEDDFLNIQRLTQSGMRSRLIVYLFGYPPVARSRMLDAGYLEEGEITNKSNENFWLRYEANSGVVLPEMPVMNFTVRKKLSGLGITNFGIDLSFIKPDKSKWKELYSGYLDQKNLPDTTKFNFKRGLH
ncbi:MAG: peptidase U32 family protein [Elusimicrobiota bacterium]